MKKNQKNTTVKTSHIYVIVNIKVLSFEIVDTFGINLKVVQGFRHQLVNSVDAIYPFYH